MSKTYVLQSIGSKGGTNDNWTSGNWDNYYLNSNSGEVRECGQRLSGGRYCAVYYMFNAETLASLKQKTITSVKLTITINDGTGIPGGASDLYAIREKDDNTPGSSGSGTAWKGKSAILGWIRRASGSSATFDVTLSTTIPTYGYTMGAYAAGYGQYLVLASTATLTVTTNETDYTVSYNKGVNGTGTNVSDTKVHGVALTLRGRIFTRTGYLQDGWATSDGGGIAYALGESYTTNASITLYPHWTPNTYTITYNKGSYGTGSQVTDTKTYGVALTLRGATFTRPNYSQDGWSVNADGSTKDYNLSGSYTNNAAATLYPHWKADTYAVNFNANGGTGAPAAQTKTYGVALTLSSTVPIRTNYIFLGWATSASGTVAYQPGGSYTTNAAVTLYAIWQAVKSTLSTITSSVNIGSSGTASWNIVNSAYTFKLVITYGNAPAVTVNVAANTSSTSFTIPTTWYAYLPNVTSVTATATLTTYSGSTSLGSTTKTFTVAVASSVKPTISSFTHAPYSQNNTVNGWGVYVQGYSQVDLSVSAAAGTGASIVSIAFSGTGISQSGTATTARSSVLSNTGYLDYSVTVTDSRGRSTTSSLSGTGRPYFYEYSNPVVTAMTAFRSNSSGVEDAISGTYIRTSASFTFSSCGNKNSLSVKKIEYKLHTASSWTSGVATATSGTAYTIGGGNIAITSSYDVRCTVTDALSHTTTYVVLVPPIVGFAVGLNNDRARFGGPVEKAGLQVDWDSEFNGVLDVTKRRCEATLPASSGGSQWYRVFDYSAANEARVTGDIAFSIDITILEWARQYHKITLYGLWGALKFGSEISVTDYSFIDKIRYWKNGTHGYIDVHFIGYVSRYMACYFDVKCVYADNLNRFSSMTPTAVVDSPSGSELATYTFAANGDNNFKTISVSKTTTSGAFSVTEASVNGDSRCIATPQYFSATPTTAWFVMLQPVAGSLNVYIRDASGNIPADGTRIDLDILIDNR